MNSKILTGLLLTALFGLLPSRQSAAETTAGGFSGDASAARLRELAGDEYAAALLSGEKPVVTQFRDPRPAITPRHSVLKELMEAVREDLGPGVMVETLHLYKKPPEAAKGVWSAEEETGLYNGVLALSTLKGLQYYSASRKTMRTFYETSSVIDGPSSKKPLPDPEYPRPLTELTVYARQKDLTFGDNIYKYDFYAVPGALIFFQENLTTLTVGIIPAVGKNKLRSIVSVLDAGEYLLVYAASMARAASIPGMNERVGNSFANRAEAVLNWFSSQADKAFKKINN